MVRYITATYQGGGLFTKGQTYPLAIKKHWWSKRIQVYQRRGYYDAMAEGTLHSFSDWDSFNKSWEVRGYDEQN